MHLRRLIPGKREWSQMIHGEKKILNLVEQKNCTLSEIFEVASIADQSACSFDRFSSPLLYMKAFEFINNASSLEISLRRHLLSFSHRMHHSRRGYKFSSARSRNMDFSPQVAWDLDCTRWVNHNLLFNVDEVYPSLSSEVTRYCDEHELPSDLIADACQEAERRKIRMKASTKERVLWFWKTEILRVLSLGNRVQPRGEKHSD